MIIRNRKESDVVAGLVFTGVGLGSLSMIPLAQRLPEKLAFVLFACAFFVGAAMGLSGRGTWRLRRDSLRHRDGMLGNFRVTTYPLSQFTHVAVNAYFIPRNGRWVQIYQVEMEGAGEPVPLKRFESEPAAHRLAREVSAYLALPLNETVPLPSTRAAR